MNLFNSIMEIGNFDDLEKIFKEIFTKLDDLIIEKTMHLQNKLNNIQEYLLKFEDLNFSGKLEYLEKINEVIKYKIKSIERKENYIKGKIDLINKKLIYSYLSNKEVLDKFLIHGEEVKNYKEKMHFFKDSIIKINMKINELENCSKTLKVVKYEFKNNHLKNNDISNLKIFAESFIDIYKNITIKLNEADFYHKSNID
jgi:hypothetical protein